MRTLNRNALQNYIETLGNRGAERLAIEADLSISAIDKMLRGKMNNPKLDTISRLCLATGLDFEELFPFAEDEVA